MNTNMDFLNSLTDLSTQFLANIFGTIFGGVILFWLIEKRLKDNETQKNRNKFLNNLYDELVTNSVINDRIIEHSTMILQSNKFPIAKFKTKQIDIFLSNRPVEEIDNFYTKIQTRSINFESANTLIELISYKNNKQSILENKKTLISSAKKINTQIIELINIMTEYNNIYKFKP